MTTKAERMAESEARKAGYDAGSRRAYVSMLEHALSGLNYKGSAAEHAAWIREREATVSELRRVCATFGDNDWPIDLNLANVVDKHLGRYLQGAVEEVSLSDAAPTPPERCSCEEALALRTKLATAMGLLAAVLADTATWPSREVAENLVKEWVANGGGT